MLARLRMPPDSSAGSLSLASSRPTCASFMRTASSITSAGRSNAARIGSAMLSCSESELSSAPPWNTRPRSRRSACRSARGRSRSERPSTTTSPVCGASSPARARSRVVFPQPEGPMIKNTSPRVTVSSIPCTIGGPP